MRAADEIVSAVRRRPTAVGAAVIVVLVVWLFSSALFSSKVLGAQDVLLFQTPFAESGKPAALTRASNPLLFDTFYQLQPDLLYARQALRDLRIPAWNPYLGAGEPTWATQQHSALFPINWLAIIFPFWQSLEWLATLKLLAAGLGTLLFLRRLGLRAPSAVLGGVTFAFSSYLIDWLEHPLANAWVLAPLLLWCADQLAERARPRDAGLLALLVGSALLGGNPQSAFVAFVPVLPWFVMRLVQRSRALAAGARRRVVVPPIVLLVVGALLGLLVTAIVLVPFAELAGQAQTLERNTDPLPHNSILSFFAPELWGRPDKFEIGGGPVNYLERTAYFGVVPVLLAVGGLFARRRAPQIFFAVLALLTLGYVVEVPVYTSLVEHLPILGSVRRDRFLVLVGLAGAVLAAYGLEHLLAAQETVRRRWLLALGAALAAVVPLGWLVQHHDVLGSWHAALHQLPNIQRDPPLDRPVLQLADFLRWALFGLAGLALIVVATIWRRGAVACALALVLITGLDLVSFQRGFHPATPIAWADPPTPGLATYMADLTVHDRIGGLIEMQPNLAERFHIRDVRAYESPPLRRRSDLWTALGGQGTDSMVMPPEATSAADVFAVRYDLSYALSQNPTPHWRKLPNVPIVENRFALPRAFVAYDWRPARGESDALDAVKGAPPAMAYRRPVIEGVAAPAAHTSPPPSHVTFGRDDARHVDLTVVAKRPGWLVLEDTWYPGWKASVDGHDEPIEHANVAFRAVRVPPGRHTVAFSYEPSSLRLGELLTLLAALGIAALLILPRFGRPFVRRREGSDGAVPAME